MYLIIMMLNDFTPGDTETASVQVAGLAVEKQLGGTFSDSARGRSSYTASTAGNLMTVFSEVSWLDPVIKRCIQ